MEHAAALVPESFPKPFGSPEFHPAGPLEPLPAPAPIVKWAGGKSRIMAQLRRLMPPAVEKRRLLEPFLGGGAMFFSQQPERAMLSDVNDSLIGTYVAVRDHVSEVVEVLRQLAIGHNQDHYYRIRERYNKQAQSAIERAATFLYLNRTCFNGLHRVNRSGEFNVPFGRYKNPRIVNEGLLYAASSLLRRAQLRSDGFEHVLESARPGDFVYFDPPYVPLSASANFTGYAQSGFGLSDQVRLRDVVRVLDRRGCHVMLSNSDTDSARDLYQGFRLDTIAAPRAISCKGKKRKPVTEIVVRNY